LVYNLHFVKRKRKSIADLVTLLCTNLLSQKPNPESIFNVYIKKPKINKKEKKRKEDIYKSIPSVKAKADINIINGIKYLL
jgi:hypothetical protein